MKCRGKLSSLQSTVWRGLALTVAVTTLPLFAQAQRALTNTDFEDNNPRGPGAPNYQIYDDIDVPGWVDQTGKIELWDDMFQSVPSYSGQVHAEMNANSPGTLYQDICMETGENFDWTFAHAARSGGPGHNPQVAVFEIVDPGTGILVQSLATQNSFIGGGWSVNVGAATYTGPAGVQRFQFRSTNPGSYGNFLDNIVVSLAAYVEMGADDANAESISSGPGMIVSGTVDVATNVSFSVTGGTATLGSDYTIDAGSVTVPPGVYPDVFFPLPITILDDAVFESDETIAFAIGAPSSAELTIASGQCGPAPNLAATYTIYDNDPNLDISKTVETFDPALAGADIFSVPGNDVIYTFYIENTGNGPIDTDSLLLIDELPDEIIFFNGDMDGPAGPETNAISFSQTGTGLSFDPALHVAFSDSGVMPSTFADCTYSPSAGYDEDITHICIQPDGHLDAGAPGDTAVFQFRALIR